MLKGKHQLKNRVAAACLAAILIWTIAPAIAQSEAGWSIDEAVAQVKKVVDGNVVRASSVEREGRAFYEIRVITDDGTVRTILFDAESGQMD
jgi:uncharacterized membrane protein YkoI